MMRILIIYPYESYILNALYEAITLNLSEFILVGNKTKIIEDCYNLKIPSQKFVIYDLEDDLEVINFAKKIINNVDYLMFGNYPFEYQNKIIEIENEHETSLLDIIDFPSLKHFVFISNSTKNIHNDFNDKRIAIMNAVKLMNVLKVKKINIGLISPLATKLELLEASIIKMITKDVENRSMQIYNFNSIYSLFNIDSKINIYKNNINLLIMRNYDVSKFFIDTLYTFSKIKYSSLIIGKYIGVDLISLKSESNVIFTMFILEKLFKELLKEKLEQSG